MTARVTDLLVKHSVSLGAISLGNNGILDWHELLDAEFAVKHGAQTAAIAHIKEHIALSLIHI